MKVRAGNFFEDFRLGQRIPHPTPRTITDGDCALYIALTGARQPLHCAAPAAALPAAAAPDGKPHPDVVLDLDYTVLMPRKGRA